MNNQTDIKNDIELKEIIQAILQRKLPVTILTTLISLIGILYSLSLPNIYISSAQLTPTNNEDSLSNKLSGYSSLAGIAGFNIPIETGNKSLEAIERIKSYDFFEKNFLPFIKLEDLFAAKDWSRKDNIIIYDTDLFNSSENKWVRKADYPMESKPSNQEAFVKYKESLKIYEDKKTSFVVVSFEHVSPNIAKNWLNIIIKNINKLMKNLDKLQAQNSIDFLNESLTQTSLAEVKVAISQLLESQVQILMLAEASQDYVFKIIESPIAPEKKSKPSRGIICIIATFIGFILSIIISLIHHYYKKPTKSQ